jgi:[amino group carrier protein]-L-2-aminoadipate 6-kinase
MKIIKIGGGKSINYQAIIKRIADLDDKCIIIHGANHLRDELSKKIGYEKKVLTSVSGVSSVFSDIDMIQLIQMAYAGIRNTELVALGQKYGINTIGLSGVDGGLIKGKKNSGIKVIENGKRKIVRDLSGKARSINYSLLNLLLENNYTPIISIPILSEDGEMLNTENDDIVALLSQKFDINLVVHFIEAPGLLIDSSDSQSVINHVKLEGIEELNLSGRIQRKIMSFNKTLENNEMCKILITDGRIENPVDSILNLKGTIITKN